MIRLWDTATGSVLRELDADSGSTSRVAMSTDGRWLAAPLCDGRIGIATPEARSLLQSLAAESSSRALSAAAAVALALIS
jgi:hypothetical protein